MEDPKMHNNVELIYSYTEKEIDEFNKSINNLASKLAGSLAFSGVALKLIADLPNDSIHFWIRFSGSIILCISIGFCVSGLLAKDGGQKIRAKALLREQAPIYYQMTDEQYRLCIIRQWHKHIESLENLLDERRGYLNMSIGLLALVGLLYTLNIVILSIR